nr:MAG TPA: hypothetical protein [Caudoviricetes sp.]
MWPTAGGSLLMRRSRFLCRSFCSMWSSGTEFRRD